MPHHFADLSTNVEEPLLRFEQRLAQADAYLEILIKQVAALEKRSECEEVVQKANEFLEGVKHSIVLLQIAKVCTNFEFVYYCYVLLS